MALFGSDRDLSMFRLVNKEMINRMIDTSVYYYKFVVGKTEVNVYGETTGDGKAYYQPLKLPAVVEIDLSQWNNDIGKQDQTRTGNIYFLRDSLKDDVQGEIYPEMGDVIEWEGNFWEIDAVTDDDMIAGKGEYWEGGQTHGQLWSLNCTVHKMRKEISNIIPFRNDG